MLTIAGRTGGVNPEWFFRRAVYSDSSATRMMPLKWSFRRKNDSTWYITIGLYCWQIVRHRPPPPKWMATIVTTGVPNPLFGSDGWTAIRRSFEFRAYPSARDNVIYRPAGLSAPTRCGTTVQRLACGFGRQPSALLPYDFSLLQIGSSEPDIYTLSPFSDDNGDAMS